MRDLRLSHSGAVTGVPTPARDLPISARGLRLQRGGKLLIDVPDLTIETVGPTMILGPNGAGKSVLIRLLHGLVEPDAGQITLAGRDPDRAARARQAMVFQRPVLLRRSVTGNLHYVLRFHGVPRSERRARVRDLLARGDLSGKGRQSARSLSGGEGQRLALIRALAGAPEILFLDEPTSSLDPGATQRIEALIARAARAGTKVIMVTHDLGQARRLGEEILFLNGGRVEEQTPVADFFPRPRSAAARAFVDGHLLV